MVETKSRSELRYKWLAMWQKSAEAATPDECEAWSAVFFCPQCDRMDPRPEQDATHCIKFEDGEMPCWDRVDYRASKAHREWAANPDNTTLRDAYRAVAREAEAIMQKHIAIAELKDG